MWLPGHSLASRLGPSPSGIIRLSRPAVTPAAPAGRRAEYEILTGTSSMGYEVHITRADDWASNEGSAIEPSEWLDLIDRDTSLRLAGYNGPYFAIWDGEPILRRWSPPQRPWLFWP